MDRKATGVVAYLGWIGWLIAYLAGDKEGGAFHLNQGLILAIVSTVGGAILGTVTGVFGNIPFIGGVFAVIGGLLAGVWGLLMLILMVLGIVNAANDQFTPLPLIGGFQLLK